MHYFQKNIADYRKDTSHLSLLEHGIYNQLIDTYYLDEKPIETKGVIRRLSIKTEEEKLALENVLNDFFEASECGNFWSHSRIKDEILKYKAKVETAKANGSKGGRPPKAKKTKGVNSANPKKTGSKANQEPITNNHKPITNTNNSLCADSKSESDDLDDNPDSLTNKKITTRVTKPQEWKDFYAEYPEERSGGNDQTPWKKAKAMKLTTADFANMLEDVRARKREDPQWIKGFVEGITKYVSEELWKAKWRGGSAGELGQVANHGNLTRNQPVRKQLSDNSWAQ